MPNISSQRQLELHVLAEMGSLNEDQYKNYDSLVNKYPNLSRDAVMSMVRNNVTVDTPGVDKIATVDGIAQLKNPQPLNLRQAVASQKQPLGGRVVSAITNPIYEPIKFTSRVLYGLARSPYDVATVLARNSQMGKWDIGNSLEATNLGSLIKNYATSNESGGNGFFISPESKTGKDQANAMMKYGMIGGTDSYTIGRNGAKQLGLHPGTIPYKVASGLVDAFLNVALDFSKYMKIFKAGQLEKEAKGLQAALSATRAEAQDTPEFKAALKQRNELIKTAKAEAAAAKLDQITRVDDRFLQAEKDLQEAQRAPLTAQEIIAQKKLNLEKNNEASFAKDPEAAGVLSNNNLTHFIVNHPKAMTGELTDAINTLSADVQNTGMLFPDAIHMDTLPAKGQISIGANDLSEYFVTATGKKSPKIVDLGADFAAAAPKERQAEMLRRANLMDAIANIADNADLAPSTRAAAESLSQEVLNGVQKMQGFMFPGVGDPAYAYQTSLAYLIASAGEFKDAHFMQLLADEIKNVYKADIFSNTRSIYGSTGGFAVVGDNVVAARKAKITDAIANFKNPEQTKEVSDKILKAIEDHKQAISEAEAKLAAASAEKASLAERLKQVDAFKNYARKDPELLQKIANDPEYMGLQDIINLNIKLADANYAREYVSREVGLIDQMGGPLSLNADKVIKFILGKNGDRVAEIVAKIESPVEIHKLFGRKLEADIVNDIAKATTADQVKRIFLNYLNANIDINVARSMSLKMEAAGMSGSPLAKLVHPVNLQAVRTVRLFEEKFNRMYVRAAVYNLHDTTQLVNGIEDWATSIRQLSTWRSMSVGMKSQLDDIISTTQHSLFASESVQERGQIIENAAARLQDTIARGLGITDEAVLDTLKRALRVDGKEKIGTSKYSVNETAFNRGPDFIKEAGETVQLQKGLHPWQVMQDTVRLPDTRHIEAILVKYKASVSIIGKAEALEFAAQEFGSLWRTAQLAFRGAYILRNIGEMQVRSYLGGSNTLLNTPLQFFAMVAGNPEGGSFGRFLANRAKYQKDAFGNNFKAFEKSLEDPNIDRSTLDAMFQYQRWMHRDMSAGDYRLGSTSPGFEKNYDVRLPGNPDYFMGLGFTLSRMATDSLDSAVAKLVFNNADETTKRAFVDNMINTLDNKQNPLHELSMGLFRKSNDLMKIIFKNPKLENKAELLAPSNFNADEIYRYLFDTTEGTFSVANELISVAGTGPLSKHIQDILMTGETLVSKGGKTTRITVPWLEGNLSGKLLEKREDDFKKLLARTFSPEDLVGSRVLVAHKSMLPNEGTDFMKKSTTWFFQLSTKLENVANFGPEYQQAYWAKIFKYHKLLSNNELEQLYKASVNALNPSLLSLGGREVPLGRVHPIVKGIRKELDNRSATGYVDKPLASLEQISSLAAKKAGEHISNLFYDAHNQRQWANAWRLIFPFAQAQYNTLITWAKLVNQNPIKVYRFGKAFDALTRPGTNVIYDITGLTHDANQGYFYTDPNDPKKQKKFKIPLAGNVIGMLAGRGISAKNALEISSPVSSLNVAFGQVNPLVPGVGSAGNIFYQATRASHMFGPGWDLLRNVLQPFGQTDPYSLVLPAWLRKTFLYSLGNEAQSQSNTKDWAAYLASTGRYGDNALMDTASRNSLFNDAQTMSGFAGFFTALFQNISPSTPQQEVLSSFKTPENKTKFMTLTLLYNDYKNISDRYPGDVQKAQREFADQYGINNLLVLLGSTNRGVTQGTQDAWTFLNENPNAAKKYSLGGPDIIPYFFPGGEFSSKYYQWQQSTGSRTKLTADQLNQQSASLVYSMMQSAISQKMVDNGYPQSWYNDQIENLNKQFGGAKPPEAIIAGSVEEKIARIGKALQDPTMASSPVYNDAKRFYDQYNLYYQALKDKTGAVTPSFQTNDWTTTQYRTILTDLADQIIAANPSFASMYYNVFYSQLKA